MKNQYILGSLVVLGMALTSCDDFLNDNRFPMSQQTVNQEFWSNSVNVQNQINYFYEDFSGYGNGTGSGDFYYKTLNDDQCGRREFTNWTNTNVPSTSTYWNNPYIEIRRAFSVIDGIANSGLLEDEKTNFTAIAKLHIARNYFLLVKRYGDVPLVKKALDPADEAELFGERVSRNEVMDYVLQCLDEAIAGIAKQSSKTEFSRDMAQAVKAEICLFEGSYAKYHKQDNARATKFFQESVKAGEAIAASYPIGADYTALYKSFRAEMDANAEVIFAKMYEKDVFMHSIIDYSSASDGIAGLTRDAFDSYLFLDGKPKASTTLDNTDKGVPEGTTALSIDNLLNVRDKRLSMTTYDHVFFPGMTWTGPNTAAMYSRTGYGVSKYDNFSIPESDATTANKGYNCAPLFWGARLYLAIAEAKAELGTLTDADVNKYLNPLFQRAGLPDVTVASMTAMADPANNMGVSSLLWEIRRCRRCELIMDDDIRYWDLVRWHQLELLDTEKHPASIQGAYVVNAPIACNDMLGDYCDASYGVSRKFSDREYFWPIPSGQIQLNKKLTQNPGW